MKQNYVHGIEDEDDDDPVVEENHFFTADGLPIFLKKDEEFSEVPDAQRDEDYILANEAVLEDESADYQRGYMNALTTHHKQYSLRRRDVPVSLVQKRKEAQPKNDSSNIQKKGKEPADLTSSKGPSTNSIANEKNNQQSAAKEKVKKKDLPVKEVDKVTAFSLENEIAKLKVSIPLTESIKNTNYKHQVSKILHIDPLSNTVNVEDDHPELIFGPALEGQYEDSEVPPFYISLRLHEYVLHNAMFDSEASHNLMPKSIMEKLGFGITRKYHDLYSFDSGRVHCIGLIKDLVVSLDQIPAKNVLMDVVVADILPQFGTLLSRSWSAKLKGTLQLDFSYATIPIFGQLRKIYREKKMKYMITSKEKPLSHPINVVHTCLVSFVLYSDSGLNDVDSQLVEVEDVPEISENFRAALDQ